MGSHNNKLFRFDVATFHFQEYTFDPTIQLDVDEDYPMITSITEDCRGRFWIGVINKGVYCWEPWSGEYKLFRPDHDFINIPIYFL